MRFLQKRPWAAAVLGFLSIYIVWAIPAIFLFKWNEWFSWAYTYGDHFVLPLFNALSFWLLIGKNKGKIPWWSIAVPLLCGALLVFFEPDAAAFREAGKVELSARLYHSVFIFFEFSFIVFMLFMYPFVPKTYAPLILVTPLYLLILVFLWFAQGADASMHDFSPAETILPSLLLSLTYLSLLLDRVFRITGRAKRWIVRTLRA